ncbi:unnamed protein product, partial [Porites lobata]
KVKKVVQGDNTSEGSIIEVYFSKDVLTAEIIAVDDENSNLDHLLINFLQDVKIKHRFPSDETSEEDREIIKEGANKKKVSLISIYP